MLDVLSLAEEDTNLHRAAINEQAGPCPNPKCGGSDRFRVRWSQGAGWRFMCRHCYDSQEILTTGKRAGQKRGWGDAIDYLWHYRGIGFKQAKAMTEGQEAVPEYHGPAQQAYLSDEWQQAIGEAMQTHIVRMQSDDTLALDYAHKRGLYDHIIKQFQLGYSIHRGIPYLVIPSINDGHYVTVYRRDLRPDVSYGERWKDVAGGGKSELYLADCLYHNPNKPVVLCEDALSALSVYQECGDLVNVVATGGVDCCMNTKWIARLACMPLVLVALDADAAGDKHAAEWLKRLKNGRRLRPLLKDANDMLMDGWDLRAWVLDAIAAPAQPIEKVQEEPSELLIPFPCNGCEADWHLAPDDAYNFDPETGLVYCPVCWEKLQAPESLAQDAATYERLLAVANRIAESFPGGCVVHVDPPGYTIEDRVRDLLQEEKDKMSARIERAHGHSRKVNAA